MTLNDDPKLTAFALGELSDAEREALEAQLDDAARAEIAEIEKLGDLLSAGLAAEPLPALDPAQRDAIEAAASDASDASDASEPDPAVRALTPAGKVTRLPEWFGQVAVVAATLAILLGLAVTNFESALNDAFEGATNTLNSQVSEPVIATAGPDHVSASPTRYPRSTINEAFRDRGEAERPLPVGKDGVADRRRAPAETAPMAEPAPMPSATPAPGRAQTPNQQGQQPYGTNVPREAPADGQPRVEHGIEFGEGSGDVGLVLTEPPAEPRYKKLIEEYRGRLGEPEPATPDTHAPAPAENDFVTIDVARDPESALSTFSIDVDTASYANVRSYLTRGALPPASAVRIEELINYFDYDYAPPTDGRPFASHVEVANCPWNSRSKLVRIGLQGREIARAQRPASNLVFLLDVSGSMSRANKLPLLKQALELLVAQLDGRDRVSIVVYAGASGLVLPPTSGEDRRQIVDAFNRLQSGGSTNGGAGIELAYAVAEEQFIEGGVNRVILATDGDFNVGTTSRVALTGLIERKAKSGVFLSVLGFGMSGRGDGTMETLADKGNGNYGYIDTIREAEKILINDMTGTLVTIAKDVKIQVDFNHHLVESYRLIGYENRMLAAQDFLDDTKDAGEIGAGHTVTALYEVLPKGAGVIPSRYQDSPAEPAAPLSDAAQRELLTVRLNYKQPDSDTGQGAAGIIEVPLETRDADFAQASTDFRFAAAVAAFGQILRDSKHKGSLTLADVAAIVDGAQGDDRHGYRGEFRELVEQARKVTGGRR